MGVTYVKEVISPEELLDKYPLSAKNKELKAIKDAEIKKVFTGESDKFLVIIGPCSADNEDSVCDYINRLAKVQDKVSDKIIIIPRIYTTNQELQVRVIRELFISQTLRKSRIYLKVLLQ